MDWLKKWYIHLPFAWVIIGIIIYFLVPYYEYPGVLAEILFVYTLVVAAFVGGAKAYKKKHNV